MATAQKALVALLSFVVFASVDACKPKAGDTCKTDACSEDGKTLLACKHERLLPVPCDGPKGCKLDGTTARCDFSGNKAGSPCDEMFIGKRMCKDGKTAIGCSAGKFALLSCGGPGGCTSTGPEADALVKDCDATVAKAGDECEKGYTVKPACAADGKTMLECGKDNKFAFKENCRGAKGCVSKGGEVTCDHSVQLPDDPCMPPVPAVCSADNAAILLCNGTAIFEKMCPGPRHCTATPDSATCDTLLPVDGTVCDMKGQKGCQKAFDKDPARVLECDGKKWQTVKRCTGACEFVRPNSYECK